MAHTKLFAAVAAAALTLTAGASSATAYNPGNPHTPAVAIENCEANVVKQFDLGLSGGRGPKSGFSRPLALTNCNKYFGAPGQTQPDPRMGERFAQVMSTIPPAPVRRAAARSSWPVPDARFVEAIMAAYDHQVVDASGEYRRRPLIPTSINEQLEQAGAPYRMEAGEMVWVGDEELNERAIEPALRFLQDTRLADTTEEFAHALANRARESKKGQQDAVNDAARAIEAAEVPVLTAHAASLPPANRPTAEPLWNALIDQGIAEKPMKEIVIGGVRNEETAHGPTREATQAEAEAPGVVTEW